MSDDYRAKVEELRSWYARKARCSKLYHGALSLIVITIAALTPVAAILESKVTTVALASALAALTAISQLFGFQRSWIRYRAIAEQLRNETRRFDARILDYKDDSGAFDKFARRVESAIDAERAEWVELRTTENPNDDQPSQ